MTELLQNISYALRQLRKYPGFTAVAIVTLALGIGANTAVFSVVDAVMLRPLPYDHPEQLVEAQSIQDHVYEAYNISYPDFFDWRTQNHTLQHLVSYHDSTLTLTGLERPVQVDAQVVSWDLLPALGVRPELGRGFLPEEEKTGSRVVLISHALWTSQFSADKSILGRAIHLSGELYTVVGVMPPNFRFPVTASKNGIWTTLAVDDDPKNPHSTLKNRGMHFINVFGRLKSHTTLDQASQDLNAIAANLAREYPGSNARRASARVIGKLDALLGDTRITMLVILGSVALVLVIACGNIANLLLARMRERQREMALRSALGAGQGRIIRQLLAESMVLSACGGLVGCLLAYLCTPAILKLMGDSVPRAADAGVNVPVLLFALGLSLAAGIIFGIVPAFAGSRADLLSVVKQVGRTEVFGRDWARSSLIIGQVAMGLVLTVAAGLLFTSFSRLMRNNQGFDPHHLTTMFFETPDAQYKDNRSPFYREYFEKVRALPGVESAGGVMILPNSFNGITLSFEDPEHPAPEGQRASADFSPITPEYFKTMRIPLLEGRDFSERDDVKSQQVLIVNRAFADKFFPGEEVLGKKLKPGARNAAGEAPWREIVGVVGNVRLNATDRALDPAMYAPASQLENWCCLFTVIRSSVDPQSLAASVQRALSSLDKNIPLTQVRSMDELMFRQLAEPRFALVLLGTFSGLAVILTIVGLYGVMTYSVSRRTREIGVRMALGAQRALMMQMILRDAAILLIAGIAIGLTAALASASVLQSMLYGTGTRDPKVIATVCGVIAVIGLISAYIPARRAARVEPMVALRYE